MLTNLMYPRDAAEAIHTFCTPIRNAAPSGRSMSENIFFSRPNGDTHLKLPLLGAVMFWDRTTGLFVVSLEGYFYEEPGALGRLHTKLEAVQFVHKRCPLRSVRDGFYYMPGGTSILIETYLPSGSAVFVQDVTITAASFQLAREADGMSAAELNDSVMHRFGWQQ